MAGTDVKSIFAGGNPIDPSNTLALFLIQVIIVIIVTRILGVLLKKIHQPRVIAEVIGGILLGPSVLGRWTWFSETFFPPSSLPFLKLVADFGLIFFLFVVGLELDPRILKNSMKKAAAVSVSGMVLPLGLGAGAGFMMYELLLSPEERSSISYGSFLSFLGIALCITALPVLARIMAERRLLQTPVGIATISAAAIDDVASWILLAVVISVIKATSPVTAVYSLLAGLAWALFMFFIVRKLLMKLMRMSVARGGVSTMMVVVTFILILVSSFVTEIVGIHSIFGGFLAGLIIPREHGFAVKLSEKIEDFVLILLLPLYFAYSGLRTQLSVLSDGIIWACFVVVFLAACVGKIVGCALASRLTGMPWRESITIGVAMNTKGLVELIVLNIGLEAGIINQSVFVAMLLMTLATTFMTTPLIAWIYPESKQREFDSEGKLLPARKKDEDTKPKRHATAQDIETIVTVQNYTKWNMLICCLDIQSVSPMLALVQLLQTYLLSLKKTYDHFQIHVLRLIRLSERTSRMMMAADTNTTVSQDPILQVFRTFASLQRIGVNNLVSVVSAHEFADSIVQNAANVNANFILLTWQNTDSEGHQSNRALETWFEDFPSTSGKGKKKSMKHGVVTEVLDKALCTVGVLVDRGFGGNAGIFVSAASGTSMFPIDDASNLAGEEDQESSGQGNMTRVFVPFFGGADDREALMFAIRLASHPRMIIHVVRYKKLGAGSVHSSSSSSTPIVINDSLQTLTDGTTSQDLDEKYIHHLRTHLFTGGDADAQKSQQEQQQQREEEPTLRGRSSRSSIELFKSKMRRRFSRDRSAAQTIEQEEAPAPPSDSSLTEEDEEEEVQEMVEMREMVDRRDSSYIRNIEYCETIAEEPLDRMMKDAQSFLGKRDLVIVGRNGLLRQNDRQVSVAESGLRCDDLGVLAATLAGSSDVPASVLVIQSRV